MPQFPLCSVPAQFISGRRDAAADYFMQVPPFAKVLSSSPRLREKFKRGYFLLTHIHSHPFLSATYALVFNDRRSASVQGPTPTTTTPASTFALPLEKRLFYPSSFHSPHTMAPKKSQKSRKAAKKGPRSNNSNVEGNRLRQKNKLPEKIRETVGNDRKVSILVYFSRSKHSRRCVIVPQHVHLMGGEDGRRDGEAFYTCRTGDISSPEGARGGAEDRKRTGRRYEGYENKQGDREG